MLRQNVLRQLGGHLAAPELGIGRGVQQLQEHAALVGHRQLRGLDAFVDHFVADLEGVAKRFFRIVGLGQGHVATLIRGSDLGLLRGAGLLRGQGCAFIGGQRAIDAIAGQPAAAADFGARLVDR